MLGTRFEKTCRAPQRGARTLARPRSLATLEPCPLGLREAFLNVPLAPCFHWIIKGGEIRKKRKLRRAEFLFSAGVDFLRAGGYVCLNVKDIKKKRGWLKIMTRESRIAAWVVIFCCGIAFAPLAFAWFLIASYVSPVAYLGVGIFGIAVLVVCGLGIIIALGPCTPCKRKHVPAGRIKK